MAEEKAAKEEKTADNVVFIGKKPVMSYVLAVITQFTNGQKEVHVKARGRSISRAVDVAEIVRNRFVPSVQYEKISIGTETLQSDRGPTNVSSIEIVMKKS